MTNPDELERLARAATPGPWSAIETNTSVDYDTFNFDDDGECGATRISSWQDIGPSDDGLPVLTVLGFTAPYWDDRQADANAAFIAAANPATILALLSANREMREEPRVLAITLEGMQGEPAGMMTVGVQMTDGQKFDLIRTNGTVISHWARLPDAEARSALTTQRGDGE